MTALTNDFSNNINSLKFNVSELYKNIVAKIKGEKMDAHDLTENLFDFAVFPNFEGEIKNLARMAEDEIWKPKNVTLPLPTEKENFYKLSKDFPVLASYILNTNKRIAKDEKEKFVVSKDRKYSCWNTGLLTPERESIFIVFEKGVEGIRQYWKFLGFVPKKERVLMNFGGNLPEICNYGKNSSDLFYDVNLDIFPDTRHILNDHPERYSDKFRTLDDDLKINALTGAITRAKESVKRSFGIAVPQYYFGNIQLMIPLHISKETPTLALVLEKFPDAPYRANTVLPLDWAYNNARVVRKPDVDWLQP